MAGTDNREPWRDYEVLKKEVDEYSAVLAERPSLVVANKMDVPEARENLERFVSETGVEPIAITCVRGAEAPGLSADGGLDRFKEALREIVKPRTRFHHTHAQAPDLKDMPDTTGDEVPAEAVERFATFLKLEKPKAKSHPSRGNIH